MTHTPGPWGRNIKPARKYPVIFAGRNTHVAMVTCGTSVDVPDAELEANCNLIAAAPDLLAACEAAEANLAPLYSSEHLVMRLLRDAIAKARG